MNDLEALKGKEVTVKTILEKNKITDIKMFVADIVFDKGITIKWINPEAFKNSGDLCLNKTLHDHISTMDLLLISKTSTYEKHFNYFIKGIKEGKIDLIDYYKNSGLWTKKAQELFTSAYSGGATCAF